VSSNGSMNKGAGTSDTSGAVLPGSPLSVVVLIHGFCSETLYVQYFLSQQTTYCLKFIHFNGLVSGGE